MGIRKDRSMIANNGLCSCLYLVSSNFGPCWPEVALSGAPGGRTFRRVKVPNPPGSGKDIANGKGVHRKVESEGSRLANLWSDEQKPHMRLSLRVRLPYNSKPNNYTESCLVNVADWWRKGTCEYPGRSAWYALKEVTATAR